jgi:hypothetical protein
VTCGIFGRLWQKAGEYPAELDGEAVYDRVSDVKVSTRSLMRDFPKAKAAARKGQAVEIVDGNTGESFVLTAKPTTTFGQLAARAKGSYKGAPDLSTREGFGA